MELKGENMDQPAYTSSTSIPSEQVEYATSPHTSVLDPRPQTTATVCGIDIVEHHYTDIKLGKCVEGGETDRYCGSPSATHIVSNPEMDGDSTKVGVESIGEDTAGTSSGQDAERSEDKDTVVPCDETSRQSEDSGASGTSLPESGWTK